MKKLKLLTIMAAATVVSASVYASPVFAADENNNTDVEITAVADNAAEEDTEAVEKDTEAVEEEVEEEAEDTVAVYAASSASIDLSVSESGETNCVKPTFILKNTGSSDLDLSTVAIKYYYTADFTDTDTDKGQTFNCYYAGTKDGAYQALTSYVKGTVTSMTGSDADSILEVSFTGGTLAAGQSMEVQANVNKANWAQYNHENDYSYNNSNKIVVTVNGEVVSGTEPGGYVEPEKKQATLTGGSSATFDIDNQADINIGVNFDGTTLKSISGLSTSDYTTTSNGVTVKASALSKLLTANGQSKTFTLNFSEGNPLTFTITGKKQEIVTDKVAIDYADTQVKSGESVTIPVKFSQIPENQLSGGVFKFKYDTNLFEDVTITAGDAVTAKYFSKTINKDTGVVSILYSDPGDGSALVSKTGTFFNITLKAKDVTAETASKLEVSDAGSFADKDENDVTPQYNMGTITVIPADVETVSIDYADAQVQSGESVTIPVTFSQIPENQLSGGVFKFKYDTNLFEDVTITAGDAVTAKYFSKTINKDTGVVSILYSDPGDGSALVSKTGTFFNITLKAKKVAAETASKLEVSDAGSFADKDENDVTPQYNMGTITVIPADVETVSIDYADAEVQSGESVTIPVTFSQIPAEQLSGGVFKFKYDTNLFEDVTITAGDAVTAKYFSKTINKNTGVVSILYSDPGDGSALVSKTGTFFNITLKAKDVTAETASKLEVSDAGSFADKDENDVIAKYNMGTITVKPGKQTGLTFNFAGVDNAAAGTTISVPVSVSGITADQLAGGVFKFKYDTNLFENVTVKAGDIATAKYFSKTINKNTGVVSILYSDPGDGSAAIANDGTFFTVTLKVKDDAETTDTQFTITDKGSFADLNEKDYENVDYTMGTIKVVGGKVLQTPELDKTSAAYDVNNPSVITVGVTENDYAFTGIEGLTAGQDYTLSGSTVTLTKTYLDSLGENANKDLVFNFTDGYKLTFNVTTNAKSIINDDDDDPEVIETGDYFANITSATVKPGETFTVNVNLGGDKITEGMPGAQLYASYDSNLLEVVDLQAGDAIADPDSDFGCDYATAGSIKVTFMEGNFDEDLYIKDAGTLAQITFKVKDNAAAGKTKINVTDAGLGISLTDANLKAVKNIPVGGGVITIA